MLQALRNLISICCDKRLPLHLIWRAHRHFEELVKGVEIITSGRLSGNGPPNASVRLFRGHARKIKIKGPGLVVLRVGGIPSGWPLSPCKLAFFRTHEDWNHSMGWLSAFSRYVLAIGIHLRVSVTKVCGTTGLESKRTGHYSGFTNTEPIIN